MPKASAATHFQREAFPRAKVDLRPKVKIVNGGVYAAGCR